jgi:hypothetical protein
MIRSWTPARIRAYTFSFGIVLALALAFAQTAQAEACKHVQHLAAMEEQALQADRCRIEIQVYREERDECAIFFGARAEGEAALACFEMEMELADTTGDQTTLNRVMPLYTERMTTLTEAIARLNAALKHKPRN